MASLGSKGKAPLNVSSLRPVLKWAGGKRSLLSEIIPLVPTDFSRYIEPFAGGAAVLWQLQPQNALVADANAELISLYECIKQDPESLVKELKKFRKQMIATAKEYEKLPMHEVDARLEGFIESRPRQQVRLVRLRDLEPEVRRRKIRLEAWALLYEEIRAWDRNKLTVKKKTQAELAARMIYLNHLGFNGLYRVNSKNQFNVPFGRYDNYNFFDEDLIIELSRYLNGTSSINFVCQSFEETIAQAVEGDFIYVDPPYAPLDTAESSFVGYTKFGFTEANLSNLTDSLDRATSRGVNWLMSNIKSNATETLFNSRGYRLIEVEVARPVNSDASKRGKVTEYLVFPTTPY